MARVVQKQRSQDGGRLGKRLHHFKPFCWLLNAAGAVVGLPAIWPGRGFGYSMLDSSLGQDLWDFLWQGGGHNQTQSIRAAGASSQADGGGVSADLLIPDVCLVFPCSCFNVIFSGVFQKHFRVFGTCASGKCNSFYALGSLKCFCKPHDKHMCSVQLSSLDRQASEGLVLVLVCNGNREKAPSSFKNRSAAPGVQDTRRTMLSWGLGLDIWCVFHGWWVSKSYVWGRSLLVWLIFSFQA